MSAPIPSPDAARRLAEPTVADLLERSPDSMVVVGTDGAVRWVSPSIEGVLGYPVDSWYLGRAEVQRRIAPAGLHAFERFWGRFAATGRFDETPLIVEWLHADGRTVTLEHRIINLADDSGAVVGFLSIGRDITAARATRAELERNLAFTRQVLDAVPAGVFVHDLETGYPIFFNPAHVRLLGWTLEEVRALGPEHGGHLTHPDDQPASWAMVGRLVAGEIEVADYEQRAKRKDGEWRRVRVRLTVSRRRPDGTPLHLLGTVTDLSTEDQLTAELRASDRRLRLAIAAAGVAAWEWDLRTDTLRFPYAELGAMASPEVFGQNRMGFMASIHPDDRPVVQAALERILGQGGTDSATCRHLAPDGTVLHRTHTATLERDADGRPLRVLGVSRDIGPELAAERQRLALEQQLQHARRLESLGVMAGGIAHDFNNLLAGIGGHAELALAHLPDGSPEQEHLRHLLQGVRRAASLTRQMLDYAGRGSYERKPVRLDALVDETMALARATISKRAEVRVAADGAPLVLGDAAQLAQVVMNLVINAAEALPDGEGAIEVATCVRRVEAGDLRTAVVTSGLDGSRVACLTVRDTGTGMDRETAARIFDPFFTTKFAGRGLGLAAVLGIVRGHGGTLLLESAPGAGTTFRALLPLAPGAEAMPTEERRAFVPAARREGVVLVADDEAAVRRVTAALLRLSGFTVVLAEDGAAAVEAARTTPDLSLVLLDLTMPGPPVGATLAALREAAPGVPVAMMSGYPPDDHATDAPWHGLPFLQKPFTREELDLLVDEVLAAPPH